MKIVEFDGLTNTIIEREATTQEQENAATALAEMKQNATDFYKKNVVKTSVVAKLGLTADEIAALFG